MNLIGMATHADCMSDSAVVRSWSASMEPETFPYLDRQDKFVGEGVGPVETFQNCGTSIASWSWCYTLQIPRGDHVRSRGSSGGVQHCLRDPRTAMEVVGFRWDCCPVVPPSASSGTGMLRPPEPKDKSDTPSDVKG